MEGREEIKTCPDCAEEIKAAARVCHFCGYRFDGGPKAAPPPSPKSPSTRRQRRLTAVAVGLTLLVGALAVGALFLVPWDELDGSSGARNEEAKPEPAATPSDEEVIEQETERLAKGELEKNITKDARKEVRAGLFDGPIKRTECQHIGDGPGSVKKYSCLAINKVRGSTAEGYEYQGTVDAESGEMTWEAGD